MEIVISLLLEVYPTENVQNSEQKWMIKAIFVCEKMSENGLNRNRTKVKNVDFSSELLFFGKQTIGQNYLHGQIAQ